MIEIYHNPRCRKSREALQLLEQKEIKHRVILYLEQPFTAEELKVLLNKLDVKADALIRKNEAVWKEQFKGKTLSEDELITAMIQHPKLIERPVVVNENEAVIARPAEKLLTLL
jgi:arsenate reductase (glutaredoxin)